MFGEWGAVCDDGFTPREGEIVCKQLGYNLGVEKVMFYKIFGKNKVSKNRVFRILKSNIHDCSNIRKKKLLKLSNFQYFVVTTLIYIFNIVKIECTYIDL